MIEANQPWRDEIINIWREKGKERTCGRKSEMGYEVRDVKEAKEKGREEKRATRGETEMAFTEKRQNKHLERGNISRRRKGRSAAQGGSGVERSRKIKGRKRGRDSRVEKCFWRSRALKGRGIAYVFSQASRRTEEEQNKQASCWKDKRIKQKSTQPIFSSFLSFVPFFLCATHLSTLVPFQQ